MAISCKAFFLHVQGVSIEIYNRKQWFSFEGMRDNREPIKDGKRPFKENFSGCLNWI